MTPKPAQRWRAAIPKGPSTRSFWHRDLDTILPGRSTESLPKSADYVIIGSGLSGALIAYDLARTLPPSTKIVILEARFAASGATGRNGGHIKPGRIAYFRYWKEKYGLDAAIKQAALEKANYEDTVAFINEQGLADEVDLVLLRAVDACMDEPAAEAIRSARDDFRSAGVDTSDMEFYEGAAAAEAFRLQECIVAASYPAASLWPYKLAMAIMRKTVELGAALYTETPVQSITRVPQPPLWNLHTPKGTLRTKNVIHATNGYASALLPQLTDKLVPAKGHAAAIVPPKNYYDAPLQTSFGFQHANDLDYLIQRQRDEKLLIYGGRDLASSGNPAIGVGDSDDSFVYPGHVDALRKFPGQVLKNWNSDAAGPIQVWSGIMGFVVDDFPLVGAVPDCPGQFICAGYNGSGMARAFLCTRALCQFIRGEKVDERVPQYYFDLEARLGSDEMASVVYGLGTADQARL